MKRFRIFLLLWLAVSLSIFSTACKSTLAPGGAYAPPDQSPDMAFYTIDASYDLAYSSLDAAFKFERDNRIMLWKVSPDIKHTLDKIRPQAVTINGQYLSARAVYMANPVPSGMNGLQAILSKIQQLAATATSALPVPK